MPGEGRQAVAEHDAAANKVPKKMTILLLIQMVRRSNINGVPFWKFLTISSLQAVCLVATVGLFIPFSMGLRYTPFYGLTGQWVPFIHGLIIVALSAFLATVSIFKWHVGKSQADGKTIIRPCWRTTVR